MIIKYKRIANALDGICRLVTDPGIAIARSQHSKGKLTVAERVEALFDPQSFVEIDNPDQKGLSKTDGERRLVTGYGMINGHKIYTAIFNSAIKGGALQVSTGEKLVRLILLAIEMGYPLLIDWDSGGADVGDGVTSLDVYSKIFTALDRTSGVIPALSIASGRSAGGSAYGPTETDLIFMIEGSMLSPTGPQVMEMVTGQKFSFDGLGGPERHCKESGTGALRFKTFLDSAHAVRRHFTFMPRNWKDLPERRSAIEAPFANNLDAIIAVAKEAEANNKPSGWDVRAFIDALVDRNSFMEYYTEFAAEVVVGLAYINGYPVALIANQRAVNGATLAPKSSNKIARWLQFANSFNFPVITLVDTPGFNVDIDVLNAGSKILKMYPRLNVPKISVIIGKAYGGAYAAMCSKNTTRPQVQDTDLDFSRHYAFTTAEVAVMGADSGIPFVYKDEVGNIAMLTLKRDHPELFAKLKRRYAKELLTIAKAVEAGTVTPLEPAQFRQRLMQDVHELSQRYREQFVADLIEMSKLSPRMRQFAERGMRRGGVWPY